MTDDPRVNPYQFPVVMFVEHTSSGEILSAGTMAIGYLEDMKAEGRHILYVETAPSLIRDRVNVSAGTVEPKPECPATMDGTTLSNIPIPSRVTVYGQTYTVDDGVLEIEFVTPGTYTIKVDNPLFLQGVYEVVV